MLLNGIRQIYSLVYRSNWSFLSFVVLIAAFVLFNESITIMNTIGLLVITLGVYFLARDKEILS